MKTTRFNFSKGEKITSVDSNEIITSKTLIKFNGDFYVVHNTYFEMSNDGNCLYIHNCNPKE